MDDSFDRSRITWLQVLSLVAIGLGSSSSAVAQVTELEPGEQETNVSVKRIRPEDLPDEAESNFPSVLRQTDALPRPASLEELRKGAQAVAPGVVRVVIIEVPEPPMRPTPMMTEGHAVWLSAEDGGVRPVLVTPHSWLERAESIWVSPEPVKVEGALPRARTAQLAEISDTKAAKRFVKRAERDGWIQAKPSNIDKHRNLSVLTAKKGFTLEAPKKGLKLFDIESKPTTRIYGFSPALGSALVATSYVEPTEELALSYYLQSTFPAVLGAPLVTDDAEVVGLTVFRHPEEPGRTLVVPPLALARFVATAQGLQDGGGPTRREVNGSK